MAKQRIRFLDVFEEDKEETLKLKIKLKVRDEVHQVNESFRKGDKLAGVDFHLLRYFDFAVIPLADDVYELDGFFSTPTK